MIKRIIALVLIVALICSIIYFFMTSDKENKSQVSNENEKKIGKEGMDVEIKIGDKNFVVFLEENETALDFMENLPMTVKMKELNSNEKYYDLSNKLSTLEKHYPKIEVGDLMLYGDKTIVLFYETFSTSYSYTRIGKVQNTDGLKAALGQGDVEVTFNLVNNS